MKARTERPVKYFSIASCACLVCAVSGAAWADDLPLTVEDLITDKGKIKLDVSFAYANRDRQGVSTTNPVLIQTGASSFVTIPATVGESTGNSDSYVPTLGLRYGLTASLRSTHGPACWPPVSVWKMLMA